MTTGVSSGAPEGERIPNLKSGDPDYRAFVGPPSQYDIMGATQFSLLFSLGMRSNDRVLDIGCGSLRSGRLFIAYLDSGKYTGIEPNKWLVDDAIEKQIGKDVLSIKAPTFVYNDQFDVSGLGKFDFIVTQSIASHTGPDMTKLLLRSIDAALLPKGIAAVTFMHSRRVDNAAEGWFYPEGVRYRRETIDRWIHEVGLKGTPIAWFHPRQTWWLVVHEKTVIPPRVFRWLARGETLAMKRSWDPVERARGPANHVRASIGKALRRR